MAKHSREKTFAVLHPTMNVFYNEQLASHRHLLLKDLATVNISHERLFSTPTAKVFLLECFAVYCTKNTITTNIQTNIKFCCSSVFYRVILFPFLVH